MAKIIDITGKKFGKLTVIEKAERPLEKKTKGAYWRCLCECGNTIVYRGVDLRAGVTNSCGCLREEGLELGRKNGFNAKELTGKRINKITVLYRTEKRACNGSIIWHCKCDCGKKFDVPSGKLVSNRITSCGCLKSKGEVKIADILRKSNVKFVQEKTFSNLKSAKNNFLRFDFFLPDYNCCIEYQGEQHYNKETFYYTPEITESDNKKKEYCKNNNIKLIEIPYWDYNKLNWNYIEERLND